MDPMKLIAYVAATFITVLLVIGGLAFYIGYSAGRKDISAVRAYIAAARLKGEGNRSGQQDLEEQEQRQTSQIEGGYLLHATTPTRFVSPAGYARILPNEFPPSRALLRPPF